FHALDCERARVFDPAVGVRMKHAARAELLAERRILRVVLVLRFLLRVEVIEVAKELVEAMVSRQEFVAVAEVVLAELTCGIAERLEELGNRRILLLDANCRAGQADLRQAGAEWRLTQDKRGAARGARLLAVVVDEDAALVPDAIDVRRGETHQAAAVGADV